MKEVSGNLWDFHTRGEWVAITTNGDVKKNGEAVMGLGTAYQAKVKYPSLAFDLGERLKLLGNHVFPFTKYKIITFPAKVHWWEQSSESLISNSCHELLHIFNYLRKKFPDDPLFKGLRDVERVYLPKVGCGAGGLKWGMVKPVIETILDDRFVVVDMDFVRGAIDYEDPVRGKRGKVVIDREIGKSGS